MYDDYNPKKEILSNSLILFPLHSVEGEEYFDIIKSYSNYLNQIKKIENNFQKISVSLYWNDYENKEILNLFSECNINVHCMGHREKEPNFLKNFIDIVGNYEYVSSDTYSSAIFYSLYMKKKVFIYGESMLSEIDMEIIDESKHDKHLKKISELYPELSWSNFDHKCHYNIAEKELGVKHKKTPKELKRIFNWNILNLLSKLQCQA